MGVTYFDNTNLHTESCFLKKVLKNVHLHFLERPQKLMKSSPSICRNVVSVKSMVKISSIFVAFLENMNFNVGGGQNLPSV